MTDHPLTTEQADRLAQDDRAFVWHPFTPMRQYAESDPTIIRAAEGFELIDTRGRRYIDGFGSLWCNLHGHQVEAIDQAIREQLGRVAHTTLLGHGSIPSIELARRLVRAAPAGLEKVFYSDSGATAVEVAQKMAFQHYHNLGQTRRTRFVAFRRGYHGDTIGAVSVGGIDAFHSIFGPLLFETDFVDCPNPYHHPAGEQAGQVVLAQIEQLLKSRAGEICGVIVEPRIQGAGGMLTHPDGFLAGLREQTARHDVLLIADEVATGFYRTGSMFSCQAEHVQPDLLCLGKGLSGGYLPVAATLTTDAIYEAFCGDLAEGKTLYHGHTFTGNALGCAAAVASFDLISRRNFEATVPARAEQIARRLSALRDHPHVGDIRQRGMMVGIELVADRNGPVPLDGSLRTGAAVCERIKARGVITRPLGDVITLMPAPAMDADTLDRLLDGTISGIEEYFADGLV